MFLRLAVDCNGFGLTKETLQYSGLVIVRVPRTDAGGRSNHCKILRFVIALLSKLSFIFYFLFYFVC